MGTGCVGCGVIVFISRCSEFGFVACVCVEANGMCSFASELPHSNRAGRRAKISRKAFFCASRPESNIGKRWQGGGGRVQDVSSSVGITK